MFKTFKSLRKYLSKIPNIHHGGCGVSALAMYKWLEKKGKAKSVKFVCMNDYGDDELTLNKFSGEYISPPDHVALLYKNKCIDCEDDINLNLYNFFVDIVDDVKIVEKAVKGCGWNDEFDKDKYIPEIEKKLGFKIMEE